MPKNVTIEDRILDPRVNNLGAVGEALVKAAAAKVAKS